MFFSCLALIEHETSLLYQDLVKRAEDPRVKLALLNILEETRKHKEVLEYISQIKSQVYPPEITECENVMGQMFKESMEFTRSLRDRMRNGALPLEVMESLIDYEKSVREEVLTLLHSRVKLLDETDTAIRKILKYIVADEERHEEMLKMAISHFKGA